MQNKCTFAGIICEKNNKKGYLVTQFVTYKPFHTRLTSAEGAVDSSYRLTDQSTVIPTLSFAMSSGEGK